MQGPTGGNTPSMAIDLERGDRTEIEWINGAVVQLGRQRGIPTPVNASIVSMVGYLSACRGDCM
jgi:2-dehydropantoate 2-reductase